MMNVYVARQPIFNRKRKIFGYELLFRDGLSSAFPDIDGSIATSKLLCGSFFSRGIERIVGRKKAFVNFTEEMLLEKTPTMLPKEKIMVEILEDLEPRPEVINVCRQMAKSGYKLVLDDFVYREELEPLIALSQIIKIDFRRDAIDLIEDNVKRLRPYRAKLLAEKVETHQEFQQALDMGFDYFQGYFFSKPQILKSRDISPSKIVLLQIMAEANREDFRVAELEKYIRRDVSISYKLMRYINSAYFGMIKKVSCIKQTIVLLGTKEVRRFLSLIAMAGLSSDKPDELVRTSLIRARLCEHLGTNDVGKDQSELFTLGLFSLIDAILDDTMENIMERLPLSEGIKSALVSGEGELWDYLNLISCYEKGDWAEVSALAAKTGLGEENASSLYIDAVEWADSVPI